MAHRMLPHRAVTSPRIAASLLLAVCLPAMAGDDWKSAESGGKVEIHRGESLALAWQLAPMAEPKGGPKFASSAFLHPLRTPSGFECTATQPADHMHHLGVWWPWKFIEVDGKRYNCWEIQMGEGANVARTAKRIEIPGASSAWEFTNETEIRSEGKPIRSVIEEVARVAVSADGEAAHVVDVSLRQKAKDQAVKIVEYRYSGFSWRGPSEWNKDTSKMTTSEGLDRDQANGKEARWVVVSGSSPGGRASVLIMSAATEIAGKAERLRVWDSKNHNGAVFVNFNPVMQKPLTLDDSNPAVSHRAYRIIAADRLIDSDEAETSWRSWMAARKAASK